MVFARREAGDDIQVRVTWEQGDAARMAEQAGHDGVERVIAGGGDGTVNEVVGAVKAWNYNLYPGVLAAPSDCPLFSRPPPRRP